MGRLPTIAAIGCALAVGVCGGAGTASAVSVLAFFRTPSGNIGCLYASGGGGPAGLRCDIRSRLRSPKPRRPPGCDLDWGDSLFLARTGRASLVCHGDTAIDPRAWALAYGARFRRDGIACSSQPAGLRCANASGHGFFLSRARWSRF